MAGKEQVIARTNDAAGVCGGILADGMGMGKTLQVIGLMVTNVVPRTLVVVPCALIDQWAADIYKYTGHRALIYYGPKKRRMGYDTFSKAPVVITSYGTTVPKTTRAGIPVQNMAMDCVWDRVVYDEAHRLRTKATAVHRSVESMQCRFRWLITGTVVQNALTDALALLSLIGVERPSKQEFESAYKKHVCRRVSADICATEPATNRANTTELYRTVVSEESACVEWLGSESRDAQAQHAKIRNTGGVRRYPLGIFDIYGDAYKRLVVAGIAETLIQQIGEYVGDEDVEPVQTIPTIPTESSVEEEDSVLKRYTKMKKMCVLGPVVRQVNNSESSVHVSSKLGSVLGAIWARRTNGHNKLVFTNYVDEMTILRTELETAGFDVWCVSGKMSIRARTVAIAEATAETTEVTTETMRNDNKPAYGKVLLIHIRTGNEGLNLQQFSEVYFPSPNWNPSMEAQAIARCARMGQTKQVSVFRFGMDGFRSRRVASMDQYIADKQVSKKVVIGLVDALPNASSGW